MIRGSRTIDILTRCVIALCAFVEATGGAEIDPHPLDIHGFEEIRHLSKLPPALAKALGWQGNDKDRIGDLEREPGRSSPTLVKRWFLLAGLSKTDALIAVENHSAYPSFDRFHAYSFAVIGSDWVASGEGVLSSQPHTLAELGQMVGSPESQAMTTRLRDWQHESDFVLRQYKSAPTLSYRANAPLRKVNINDEEVREIQGVVHEVVPGAIVLISGVAEGCPCEDGPNCSAQVWTAIDRSEKIRSLQLSDINEQWVIGPVQQWYLDSAKLERSKFPTRDEYLAARATLDNRYPTCSTGPSTNH
jgi:hypothetical protein